MTPPIARRLEIGPFVAHRPDDDEGWIIDAYEEGGALQVPGALLRDRDLPNFYALVTLMVYESAKKRPARAPKKKGRAR